MEARKNAGALSGINQPLEIQAPAQIGRRASLSQADANAAVARRVSVVVNSVFSEPVDESITQFLETENNKVSVQVDDISIPKQLSKLQDISYAETNTANVPSTKDGTDQKSKDDAATNGNRRQSIIDIATATYSHNRKLSLLEKTDVTQLSKFSYEKSVQTIERLVKPAVRSSTTMTEPDIGKVTVPTKSTAVNTVELLTCNKSTMTPPLIPFSADKFLSNITK